MQTIVPIMEIILRVRSFSWEKNCKEIADLLKKLIRDKNEV